MRKVSKILLWLLLCSATATHGQNKYAVLLGINDYYSSPGAKHPSSLHGCVNDAKSMQELLLNRFGFIKTNIFTLFDSSVTRANVLNLLNQVLKKALPGDALLFYYSGHGAWMHNALQLDSVKRKMSQAMVMSNLYAPGLSCLLTDEDLKTVFNRFVDKKVIATTLLDCCYSGKLMAMPRRDYWVPLPKQTEDKSIRLDGIPYTTGIQEPKGCAVDSARTTDNAKTDSDGDGIPDCMDWEPRTPPGTLVDSFGVEQQTLEDHILKTAEGPNFMDDSTKQSAVVTQSRAFNLADELSVNFIPKAKRPADREGSRFASLAAADEYQKAAEITDEIGTRHGAFTKALLTIYQKAPASLPLSDLMKQLTASLKQQHYQQTPTYLFEKSRGANNLVGVSNKGLSNKLTATCIAVTAERVTLDKGLYAGLTKGNVLKSLTGNKTIVVDSLSADQSMAVARNSIVKKGEVFQLIDAFTQSAPLVKLYIPEAAFTQESFISFFKNKIAPLAASPTYVDYQSIDGGNPQTVVLYTGANNYTELTTGGMLPDVKQGSTAVLLPLPQYIISPIKKLAAKNQNIELVNSLDAADFVLYLNYAKAANGKPAGFFWYYHPPMERQPEPFFSYYKVMAPSLGVSGKNLEALCKSLYDLTEKTTRYKTKEIWLNGSKRK